MASAPKETPMTVSSVRACGLQSRVVLRFLSLAAVFASTGLAQQLEHSVPLDDGDPAVSDAPFGIAFAPDGRHAYVPLAGDLSFASPQTANNDNVVEVDVVAGLQTPALGTTGLYPVEAAVALDANGAARHVYVSASTQGEIACLTPDLATTVASITVSPCFGSTFFGAFPYGLLLAPDHRRLYVTTSGGCDIVDVIDVDPASPTFNTLIDSFVVPGAGGRPSWRNATEMVLPVAIYDATFSSSRAGFATVDVTNPVSPTVHPITPAGVLAYRSANEALVVSGDRVLLPIFDGGTADVFEADVATGAVLRQLSLSTATLGSRLHGIAMALDESVFAVTSLNGGKTLFVDFATFGVAGSHDHGPTSQPNEVAFTPDGSRAVVTLQGAARVDVLKAVPLYELRLDAVAAIPQGAVFNVDVRRVETGSPFAVFFSATPGPTIVGPFTVDLGRPFFELFAGLGDAVGRGSWSIFVPVVPGLSGLPLHLQAATVDRDGTVRLSNGTASVLL
jgi:DNA-binding beta-propeller fold protein YncE